MTISKLEPSKKVSYSWSKSKPLTKASFLSLCNYNIAMILYYEIWYQRDKN